MKSILRYKNYNKGFTVIELLITIVIVAILAGIAFPPLLRARTNSMLRNDVFTLVGNLERAKSEAIRRNRNVTVDFDWAARTYVAYIDNNGDNTFNNNDLLILRENFHNGTNFEPAPTIGSMVFNSRGAIRGASEIIFITLTNGRDSYTISANRLGFISFQ